MVNEDSGAALGPIVILSLVVVVTGWVGLAMATLTPKGVRVINAAPAEQVMLAGPTVAAASKPDEPATAEAPADVASSWSAAEQPRRPARRSIQFGTAPFLDQPADHKAADPVPKMKPRRRKDGVPITLPIRPGRAFMVNAAPVGFASEEDFTGGQQSLFSTYAQAQRRARDEQAYQQIVISKGLSVADTLRATGAPIKDVQGLLSASAEHSDPEGLPPGTPVDYAFETIFVPTPILKQARDAAAADAVSFLTEQRVLARVRYRPSPREVVTAWRQADGTYVARIETLEVQKRYAAVGGVINHSLFAAAFRNDVPQDVMARFANLFLYDVDFARDIQRGDRFEVVYEVFFDEDGQQAGTGDVVFAGMSWRGGRKSRAYYRYDDVEGMAQPYFDHRGESSTRLLMKTPIDGARVTSGFGMRKHPILGYSKAHKGVDFGAPRGTPIMAAGDGVVERAQMTGSFGHYIKINHNHGYATAYAHLHGYAKGVKSGAKVRQGQIIGYVGSTGRSTGPHLHYEVLKNGKVQNPMTLDVANGRSIPDGHAEDFRSHRDYINEIRVYPLTIAQAD